MPVDLSKLKPTIGLEIHAELATKTKMFCSSRNDPDEKRPNVNVCPVCLAHPGTLPVINREAVRQVLRVGLAVGGAIADFTQFDRKSYFYPDIPKGYQISQYQYPLVRGGTVAQVALTRIHLEEDTGSLSHDDQTGESLIDFNRAGVPLLELVTEPVIESGSQAAAMARDFQLLLRYLGASYANMEKGEMRVEANISLGLGTKVEIKNLNSFQSVEKAIAYEIERQTLARERGEIVMQETRGWDEVKEVTFSQRQKESAHDYRYFPEPDLPPLKINEVAEWRDLAATLPELPWTKRERYLGYGFKPDEAEIYVTNFALANLFEQTDRELGADNSSRKLIGNYLTTDLWGQIKDRVDSVEKLSKIRPADLAAVVKMAANGKISSRGAKNLITLLVVGKTDAEALASSEGLWQKSDETELAKFVDQVLVEHPAVVADYRAGKMSALQFLVGQAMKLSAGSANPQALAKLLRTALDGT
ncbi:MAG: Asp-tRNA(Asn)/Glu-tRNA(Gln) amidotransferase subunit GatB [Patescibacteria group bacterium]